MAFCYRCGAAMAADAVHCRSCGAPVLSTRHAPPVHPDEISDRRYGVAIALCGVFGIVGIHHFYLRNYLYGFLDLGLFIGTLVCFFAAPLLNEPSLIILGFVLLTIDTVHTVWIFYRLIVGKARDGNGKLVRYEHRR